MNKKLIARFCGLFTAIATVIATLLMSFGVLFSYDATSNYFESNAILPTLATVWMLLAFASAVIFAIITPMEELESHSPFGSCIAIATPATLGFCAGGILLLIDFAKSAWAPSLAAALFLFLSAAHILLSETNRAIIFLGYVPPIACILLLLVLYFDVSTEMNAPLKVATQCAIIPLMLYFTTELRYLLNRKIPRLYLALALCSNAMSSLCVLAVPVASIAGLGVNVKYLAASLTAIGLNITIALRLKRYLQPTPSPETDTKETEAQ